MKKIKTLLTWGLLVVVTNVMGYTITVNPIEIKAGQSTNLIINLNNAESNLTAYQMNLYLPVGVTVQKKSNGRYAFTANASRHDGDFSVSVKDAADGSLLISCYSEFKDPLSGSNGELIRLPIDMASTITTSLQGSIKNIEFTPTNSSQGKPHDDVLINFTMKSNTKSKQTLSLAEITAQTYGNTYSLPTKTDQGLTLTWKVKDTSVATISGNTLKTQNVGKTTVTATQSGNDSYEAFSKDFTLTVTQAPLTVSVGNYTRQEGEDNPTFKLSYSGWKNGDSESVLTKKPTATCSATKSSPAGTYTITVSGGEAKNYKLSYKNGTLTVTGSKKVVITANDVTISKGGTADFVVKMDYNTTENITSYGFTLTLPTGVDLYEEDGEYDFTVNKDVAGLKQSRADDGLHISKNNTGGYLVLYYTLSQTPLTSTHGELFRIKLKATSDVNGVGYIKDISLSNSASQSLDQGNILDVRFNIKSSGTTVKSQQTVSLSGIPEQTYGNTYTLPTKTDQGLALTWKVKDSTIASISGSTLKTLNVGTTTVTATQSGNDSYNAFSKDYTLTVNQASLTVSVGDYSRKEGEDNPTFKLSYSGWNNGDTESVLTSKPSVSCSATKSSPAGTYTITVSGGSAKNYKLSYKNGTLTVTKKDVKTYSVRTSDAGYATFFDSQDNYSLPTGLSAQVVTGISGGKLSYKTLSGSTVPKGTAVMLKGSGDRTYTLTSTTESASYTGTNYLCGSDNATTTKGDGYHYKLCYGSAGSSLSNVFGWYWGASNGGAFRMDGHKAWLVLPKDGTRAEGFTVEGDATSIDDLQIDDLPFDNSVYDLQGRRVNQPTRKGLYIQNGKKVIKK